MRSPHRLAALSVDVACSVFACAVDECGRVIRVGDTVYMRRLEGTACKEPLCVTHGVEHHENQKLLVRTWAHAERQRIHDHDIHAAHE